MPGLKTHANLRAVLFVPIPASFAPRLDPLQKDRLASPISSGHAAGVAPLPMIHSDPLDRLLIAQALAVPARFVTADATLAGYSELVDWIGKS